MRLVSRLLWVFALPLFPIVGCNEVFEEPPSVLVRVLEHQGFGISATPFAGVEVCQTDTTNCVVSDDDGEALLELLTEEKVSLTAAKDGYLSLLQPYVPDSVHQSPVFVMGSDEDVAEDFKVLMSPYPQRGTGSVTIFVNPPPFAGATFKLIGATGTPFYEEENGTLHLDLDATSSSGKGGFVEVGPGDVQIELGGTAADCVPALAWPGDEGLNRIRVPIRAEHWTTASVFCPPPP